MLRKQGQGPTPPAMEITLGELRYLIEDHKSQGYMFMFVLVLDINTYHVHFGTRDISNIPHYFTVYDETNNCPLETNIVSAFIDAFDVRNSNPGLLAALDAAIANGQASAFEVLILPDGTASSDPEEWNELIWN